MTVNRFCSSGLQAIAFGAQAIMSGMADVILAGGVESMSCVPGGGNKEMPFDEVAAVNADAYTSMGMTAENVARRFNVSREEQDAFAAQSQARALAAQAAGRFDDELVPVEVVNRRPALRDDRRDAGRCSPPTRAPAPAARRRYWPSSAPSSAGTAR